jgi:DNA polymerase-3 subunit delta'
MKPQLPLSPTFLKVQAPKLASLFDRYRREKAMPPTLLFTGIEGAGKKSIVLQFIQTIFCDVITPESARFEPCGTCKSCKRALQNQWMDLFWLEPETNAEETRLGTHKIDAFREIKTKLGMGPAEEPFKVVVITEADRMTVPAANSILKTLEEPPKNWIFILTAADSSRLLPTILSRCIEVKLGPIAPDDLFQILKEGGSEFNSQKALVASRAAQGSLTRAQVFLEDEVWKIRGMILGFLSNPAHEWMNLIDFLSQGQKDLILGLDLIESIYTDLLRQKIDGHAHQWMHEDQKEFLTQWMESKALSTEQIVEVLSEVAEKRRFATLTLNAKMLAQEVLSPLLKTIVGAVPAR